jgi:single stranded DNA-binding protein
MMKPKAACPGSVPLFGCQIPGLTKLAINLTFSTRRLTAMQKVLLIGYLGRDPEVKYSPQGTAIKDGKPQEHTEWFGVKAFNRLAEIAGEHLHKGSRIYLEGCKRTKSWDDKRTRGRHYQELVYADRIELLDSMGNVLAETTSDTYDETTVTD